MRYTPNWKEDETKKTEQIGNVNKYIFTIHNSSNVDKTERCYTNKNTSKWTSDRFLLFKNNNCNIYA